MTEEIKKPATKRKPAVKKDPALKVSAAKTKADVKTETGEKETKSRIRIKIRAYDNKIIDQAIAAIMQVAERNNAEVVGPIPLPTEKRKYTVNRSSFVHKTSREQFEMRVHKRLIDILDPTPKVIDAMMSLNLPSGVDVEVKM